MGRKCTGPGKYIYICIAFLICFVISGCAASVGNVEAQKTQMDEPRWRSLSTDDLQEDQKNLHLSEKISSSDETLFDSGIRYADPGSHSKDYNRAITTFKRLLTEHPKSTWSYRGHVISEILQENAKLRKLSGDIQLENAKVRKQNADLLQENAKLKEIIEQSKKVDIEIEQKKRE
jgi:hypothetical protein